MDLNILEQVKDKKVIELNINIEFEEFYSLEKTILDIAVNEDIIINKDIAINKEVSLHNLFVKKKNKDDFTCCELNESKNLPDNLKDIFDDYYRYGVLEDYSFLHSILCIFDVMYSSYSSKNKMKEVDNLYNKLLFEIPKMFNIYKYQKIGCKKEFMQNKLSTNKKTDRWVQKYVSHYFNMNIIIIKINYMKYYVCNIYNEDLKTICLLEVKDNIYEPIMCEKGFSYYNFNISKLKDILEEEHYEERKILEVAFTDEDEKLLKIKLLKKMKANEIYEICEKLDIVILEGSGKKKKRKDILIDEIIYFMNN